VLAQELGTRRNTPAILDLCRRRLRRQRLIRARERARASDGRTAQTYARVARRQLAIDTSIAVEFGAYSRPNHVRHAPNGLSMQRAAPLRAVRGARLNVRGSSSWASARRTNFTRHTNTPFWRVQAQHEEVSASPPWRPGTRTNASTRDRARTRSCSRARSCACRGRERQMNTVGAMLRAHVCARGRRP